MVLRVLHHDGGPSNDTRELDLLILGGGWTATFLIPLLREHDLSFAATTTDGRPVAGSPTQQWRFDPTAAPADQARTFSTLPRARHVLITFPLKGQGQSGIVVRTYGLTHGDGEGGGCRSRFVQLGSTGIWQADPAQAPWMDRNSPYAKEDVRAVAEDELLRLGGCVLDLAGLWGGPRDPRNWINRVATTKEAVREKTSLHMIHGVDVARVIVALVQGRWEEVGKGQRWMVTDGFVYDWWSLFAGWADTEQKTSGVEGTINAEPIKQASWVYELMSEEGVRALPRPMEALKRCYDSRELWRTLGIAPLKGRLGL